MNRVIGSSEQRIVAFELRIRVDRLDGHGKGDLPENRAVAYDIAALQAS